MECIVEGCTGKVRSRLRCGKHLAQLRTASDPLVVARRNERRAELRRVRQAAMTPERRRAKRSDGHGVDADAEPLVMDWVDRSACRGMPADMFYPAESMHVSPAVVELCAGCPVRGECYDHAMRHEAEGYWAGTTPNERKSRRRKLGMPNPTVKVVGLPA